MVVTNRGGEAMLLYLPEISFAPGQDASWFFLPDDGSSYRAQTFEGTALDFDQPDQLPDSALARVSAGQITPVEGEWPLRRWLVTARTRLPGGIYLDPERGGVFFCVNDSLVTVRGHLS